MAYETVATVITEAGTLLGLDPEEAATPFSSTEPNIVQLLGFLRVGGRDLLRKFAWGQLRVDDYTFSTIASQDTYSLPVDFDRHVNETQWNHSTTLRLCGPISPQEWALVRAQGLSAGTDYLYQVAGSNMKLYPVPTGTQTLALTYQSSYWVQADGSAARDKASPTADNDILWLDSLLLIHRLRMDFRRAKRMDSTAETQDYLDALSQAKGANAPASTLSLNGRRAIPPELRLPSTGWNS